MKKTMIALAAVLLGGLMQIAQADPICTNWSTLNVCVPFTTAEVAYGYARLTDPSNGKSTGESQLLADTKIASIEKVNITFGASKGQYFPAAPYLGVSYEVTNPVVVTQNSGTIAQLLASIQPGIYAGNSNLHKNGWFYGIKTSKKIW